MRSRIIEIKAHCPEPEKIHSILKQHNADFKGLDHQIDTYFKASFGRLKLRQGNIENTLIHYQRKNQAGPKKSEVFLYKPVNGEDLKAVLSEAMGVLVVVDKRRLIFFIDNVKFHLDEVAGLGSFVEIEAIDKTGTIEEPELLKQCEYYIDLFGIRQADLIESSYSDMVLSMKK